MNGRQRTIQTSIIIPPRMRTGPQQTQQRGVPAATTIPQSRDPSHDVTSGRRYDNGAVQRSQTNCRLLADRRVQPEAVNGRWTFSGFVSGGRVGGFHRQPVLVQAKLMSRISYDAPVANCRRGLTQPVGVVVGKELPVDGVRLLLTHSLDSYVFA